MVGRGTLLNTFTVALGGLIGWLLGKSISPAYTEIALSGLGLITLGLGLKMFFQAKSIVVIAVAIALGGMLGLGLGIQTGFDHFADWARSAMGVHDKGSFVDIVIGASVLYCVGPMTLLGCIEDRLERKIDLLTLKSTMDGIVAIFYGATSGPAMIVTALVVLVFQGALTAAAGILKPVVKDEEMLADLTATGGIMLMGTGFNLLKLRTLPVANYLPALVLAPIFVLLARVVSAKLKARKAIA